MEINGNHVKTASFGSLESSERERLMVTTLDFCGRHASASFWFEILSDSQGTPMGSEWDSRSICPGGSAWRESFRGVGAWSLFRLFRESAVLCPAQFF